jgi:hypothetical protein
MPKQAKHWCFTLNNYTDEEYAALQALGAELPTPIEYLVFGKEKGQEGTPHLQGYIALSKKRYFNFIKATIGERAHIECAKGSPKQASDYCKKDEEFVEYGQLPRGKGARTDLDNVVQLALDGANFRTIARNDPAAAIRYGSGVCRIIALKRPKRDHPPIIWTFWGKTGTGKTRRVWEFADEEELWVHSGGGKWFDGYDGHRAALFDDLDGSVFKLAYLLRLLDRYPFPVEIKGGFTWWRPRTIYITTNIHPNDWYPNANEEHKRALLRRLTENGSTIQECTRDN